MLAPDHLKNSPGRFVLGIARVHRCLPFLLFSELGASISHLFFEYRIPRETGASYQDMHRRADFLQASRPENETDFADNFR